MTQEYQSILVKLLTRCNDEEVSHAAKYALNLWGTPGELQNYCYCYYGCFFVILVLLLFVFCSLLLLNIVIVVFVVIVYFGFVHPVSFFFLGF